MCRARKIVHSAMTWIVRRATMDTTEQTVKIYAQIQNQDVLYAILTWDSASNVQQIRKSPKVPGNVPVMTGGKERTAMNQRPHVTLSVSGALRTILLIAMLVSQMRLRTLTGFVSATSSGPARAVWIILERVQIHVRNVMDLLLLIALLAQLTHLTIQENASVTQTGAQLQTVVCTQVSVIYYATKILDVLMALVLIIVSYVWLMPRKLMAFVSAKLNGLVLIV